MRKPNICFLCGANCYGRICKKCYRKDSKKPLSQYYSKRKGGSK